VFKSGHAGATYGTIAAIDMALWDLKAKMAEEPLWRTLGARDRFVPGYASGLCYGLNDDAFEAHYARWAELGFTSAKIKGGRDLDRDIRRLLKARDIFQTNTARPALMLDVNECWTRKQAVRHLSEIESHLDLTWIEEPLRRWDAEGHAVVGRAVKAAIATGENLTGLDQFGPLFEAKAVDIVQTGSVWGITHFNRVAIAAHAHNLPISPVGYNANPVAHAAAAAPNSLGVEVQDFHFPIGLKVDQQIANGGIILGDAPGLGIEVDEAAIAANRLSGAWEVVEGPHVRPQRAGLDLGPPVRASHS
jgi:L-alanine-DL-glutamate epimerase-like enolase superfamily enzyme